MRRDHLGYRLMTSRWEKLVFKRFENSLSVVSKDAKLPSRQEKEEKKELCYGNQPKENFE